MLMRKEGDRYSKTRFRSASLAAVLSFHPRITRCWLATTGSARLQAKDRRLLKVFEYRSPSFLIFFCFSTSFASYELKFLTKSGRTIFTIYSIIPPPATYSPSYRTTACPGVTARTGVSKVQRISSGPVRTTRHMLPRSE